MQTPSNILIRPSVFDFQKLCPGYDLEYFIQNAPWDKRTEARQEAFWSTKDEPYTYGSGLGVRTYHPSPFPESMKNLHIFTHLVTGHYFDLCFLNMYSNERQHLGWHADDSKSIDHSKPIVVQSFGAEREIWTRPNDDKDDVTKILLEEFSFFMMMPGMQQTHQHRIPKSSKKCGPRVSLTWRKSL